MPDIPGQDQYDAPLPTLLELVAMLVSLQAEWCGREPELLALGMPDWRAAPISEAITSVLGETQHSSSRTTDERSPSCSTAFPTVRVLEECGVPDTLVHGDFAPGNARGRQDDVALLDWGDCGVGNPLLDQSAFVDGSPPIGPGDQEHWTNSGVRRSWEPIQRAAEILDPIAAARQAMIYQGFLDGIEPSEHPYHRGDPAVWLHGPPSWPGRP